MASFLDSSTFEKAAEFIRKATSTTGKSATTEQKLTVYGYYKQATAGDVTGSQPWAIQVESRSKWDAWAKVKGMSKEEAMTKYVAEIKSQIESLQLVCDDVDFPPTCPKVLLVCTSAAELAGDATGAWMEEIAAPYKVFKAGGADVTFASIAGGAIPIDAGSKTDPYFTEDCKAFDEKLISASQKLDDVNVNEFDLLFFAGGHGTCVDFPDGAKAAVGAAVASGKVVAAVCHGPCALVEATDASGNSIVKGKKVTGFTDVEEAQVGKTDKVPFLLESKLKELGGVFSSGDPWTSNAVADGKLVTGQNPQSSAATAKLALDALA